MSKFIMLVGIPGSGKSTLAIHLKNMNTDIHSFYAIRKALYGSEKNRKNPKLIFSTMLNRAKHSLSKGRNVVYDATNIYAEDRKNVLKEISALADKKICIFINTPLLTCLKRNLLRDRIVSEYIIKRLYDNMEAPHFTEGWDVIIESRSGDYSDIYKDVYIDSDIS